MLSHWHLITNLQIYDDVTIIIRDCHRSANFHFHPFSCIEIVETSTQPITDGIQRYRFVDDPHAVNATILEEIEYLQVGETINDGSSNFVDAISYKIDVS